MHRIVSFNFNLLRRKVKPRLLDYFRQTEGCNGSTGKRGIMIPVGLV